MTYLQFHAVFILPALVLLLLTLRNARSVFGSRALWTLPAISLIAFVYTTPWDNYIIHRGVWSYGADRVVGTVGYVPLEEYLFFLLQPLLVGAWCMRVLLRDRTAAETRAEVADPAEGMTLRRFGTAELAGAVAAAALTVAGGLLLRTDRGLYLGLILAWAVPVLGAQWVLVAPRILAKPRRFGRMMIVPTLYLWAADRIAIGLGIWHIAPAYTTGLSLLGLPIEEALFFLVTNLLIGQAVLLFVLAVPQVGRHERSSIAA